MALVFLLLAGIVVAADPVDHQASLQSIQTGCLPDDPIPLVGHLRRLPEFIHLFAELIVFEKKG